ncbi:acyl-CoA dehydrogenase family protein [Conexibacter sp. SYSU D00693]|uniref:acyl-CoA dehydrogenase family protein n=1 Tax=Conexibacter sp. SYSU D00693 TaxID=2812560 RepID=UPI00196AC6D7|nr:acyl-CoA dehydrogenase family protein [Conexibacter sp. SYSU D00693]
MNLALSDEQEFLREAARGALSRFKTFEAAREGLEDPSKLPDLWPTAVEAGWPGLLVGEDQGGAGLGAFDAMLVAEELGRVLAGVPFLGVIPATAILDAAGDEALGAVASGEVRPVYVPARPPSDLDEPAWTVDAPGGVRGPALRGQVEGDQVAVSGHAAYVVDAPGADLLVVVTCVDGSDEPVAVAVDAGAEGVAIEDVRRYDATRSLGHVALEGARGRRLDCGPDALADAWFLAHALVAAEAIGTVQTTLEMSVQYAKERFTFGRAIGSYQAVKHEIVEILRTLENARSLQYYAGWARESAPDEFALAASAARSAAGKALDFSSRAVINVHGGIGATWEHDAPLFFRRAQLTRRLLGGHGEATDRVAGELFLLADATPA